MWFAATYGPPQNHGGGSNVPAWTPDGAILFPRRLPGAQVPWQYRRGQPDLDHFNRDYRPDQARGGTEICRLNPRDNRVRVLTASQPPVWDFRATPSPDGKQIAFCRALPPPTSWAPVRAPAGEAPALWVMDADGGHPRRLTRGLEK